ncbi:MAG: sugar ABC transporter ATP-binding protein [Lachnospiraceae bacterium]|nr:sugar ABC transporter ATP-binding protein [Lachnospiraceae bacterium]
MDNNVILKAEHMYKSFGVTKAVADFSLELERGVIHGLIGENGSGKSTFSSMVAGLYKPDSGEMTVCGEKYAPSSTEDAAKRRVALVVQEIGTIGSVSVSANIFLNKEHGFSKFGMINYARMDEEARKILDKIGGEHIDPRARTESLNLEDRKLVEIARAMYCEPEVLIIDETSNALTTRGRRILYQNMRAVRDRGGVVLFITHDLNELVEMCDSVTIMRDGVYVHTLMKHEMDTSRMKELMVGRQIADNYYRPDFSPDYEDEVVLDVRHIVSPEVKDVSLALHRGEILGIGGLSESGMHELGRILFGVEKADSGEAVVTASKEKVTNPGRAIKNAIGYMSKNRDTEALILGYSIEGNICLPSLSRLKKKGLIFHKEEKALADKWSGELAIKMRSTAQNCSELSGGNKQKVVLAKWMGNDSRILIMDCPTRGIDIGVKESIYKLMMQFKKEGRSMIMISEELPELLGMSDRILIMRDGKISHEELRSTELSEKKIISHMI